MPTFSKRSKNNLASADVKLQQLFNEVIKEFDCTVICGHRTPEEQFELFKQGRELQADGTWKKIGATVTNIDGKTKMSNHNYSPSKAVDVVPYPLDWNDNKAFEAMAKVVKRKAIELGIDIRWGGDFISFKDTPHFELYKGK